MNYLSVIGAEITKEYVARLMSQPILLINNTRSQELMFALTKGIESIVMFVVANIFVIISDSVLLLTLLVALIFIDTFTAGVSIVVFGFFGIILIRFMHTRTFRIGQLNTELNVESNSEIMDLLNSYREVVVSGRKKDYFDRFGDRRVAVAKSFSELTFLPYISKYAIEITVIIGGICVGLTNLFFNNGQLAVPSIAVFLLSATRITPALLRIQQGWISMRGNLGVAKPTLELVKSLNEVEHKPSHKVDYNFTHPEFLPTIDISNLTFLYPGNNSPAINGVSMKISPGEVVAFVGPSGGGKSTLVDLILGILPPTSGNILISNMEPMNAIERWPGAIGFVPQRSAILNRSIRENIAFGVPIEEVSENRIQHVIAISELEAFISELPNKLDTDVQENGANLSGGQRQRLGIARALYTNPKLVILDEATSSLDTSTESELTNSILSMRGEVTLIIIAHRLSTVKDADEIYYIDKGRIVAHGRFNELQDKVPEFSIQVNKTRY